MAIQVIHNGAGSNPCLSNFFMARQPILDRHQELVAYELSFREARAGGSEQFTTTSVLEHFVELNMVKVIGDMRGVVNVDANVLMTDIFQHIPRTKFILTLTGTIHATAPLIQRIAQLVEQGFAFALDEALSNSVNVLQFLPMVDIVKFDLHKLSMAELVQLTPQAQFANKKLLVENVDSLAQFDACLALGFDYFQGYYFAQPMIAVDKKLAPSQLAVVDVITLISTDADSAAIEECIKRDVSLGLNLLRLVNSAAIGGHQIDSLRQALMVLGRNQLLSWLQVMLYAQMKENSPRMKPLLMLATTRGKLLELVAQRHKLGNRSIADTAFTVGIMSLMDTLFSLPMADILKQIAVVDEVSNALLHRQGYYGDLLSLIESTERTDTDSMLPAMEKFQLTSNDLYLIQAEAFEWSNSVSSAMHY